MNLQPNTRPNQWPPDAEGRFYLDYRPEWQKKLDNPVIRVGDTIEWRQGGNRKAKGQVIEVIYEYGYRVATGKKTVPVKVVCLSANPRLVEQGQ